MKRHDMEVFAVYYGAHRHQDGTWLPAKDCPVDGSTGRLLGFISLNGHGIYPESGVYLRPETYYLANDQTSSQGRVWACRECIIVAYPNGGLTRGAVRSYMPSSSCMHAVSHETVTVPFSIVHLTCVMSWHRNGR